MRGQVRIHGTARVLAALAALAAGCAIHPRGEREERERAERLGQLYGKPFAEREIPPLGEDPSWEEVLRHAFAGSAELEARYWEWVMALEEIPQEASPRTTAALFASHVFSGGSATFWDRTTLSVGNDPMENIPWPGKLAARGRAALERARAAGLRFERAKFDLQERVLAAYYDWALLAESVRLQERAVGLLGLAVEAAVARAQVGRGGQADILRLGNERDLAANELEVLRARVPGARARLNALLGRGPREPLVPPARLPAPRNRAHSDEELFRYMAERNPELAALAREIEEKRVSIRVAWLELVPDFGVTGAADLGGMAQALSGMITAPVLRWEAIQAGIAQARASVRAARARRLQAERDLQARAVGVLAGLGDAERQVALFETTILPRAEDAVATTRAAYSALHVPLGDLLDSQRAVLTARNALAELRMEREKLLAEAESLAAVDVERRE